MAISKFQINQCKLVPLTVLGTHNFACTNMPTEPFYMHKNQCIQILNLSSPVCTFKKKCLASNICPQNFLQVFFIQLQVEKLRSSEIEGCNCYTFQRTETSMDNMLYFLRAMWTSNTYCKQGYSLRGIGGGDSPPQVNLFHPTQWKQ